MKKLFALLLVVMMLTPLVAIAEEITINFPCIWVGTDSKAAGVKGIVDAFNEAYAGQYKVVIEEYTDYQVYRDKIRTLITADQAPYVFSFDNAADLATYSSSGRLMNLSAALTDEWVANLSDGCLDFVKQPDGAVYALPYEKAIIPMLYNTRLFAEAGIEKFPETVDELWVACEALKAKGVRAACVESVYAARMCRAINDSNVLCMGGWVIAPTMGVAMTDAFIGTAFTEGLEDWRAKNLRGFRARMDALDEANFK